MKVLKWPVPIDDQWHDIGAGPVALVDVRADKEHEACVWTIEDDDKVDLDIVPKRKARVFSTGQHVPDEAVHLGSYQDITPRWRLVWHVFGRVS